MMEKFDKELKQYFKEREIKPSENAWERMEALLDKNKIEQKKPKTLFYVLSVAATVLLFFGIWLGYQNNEDGHFSQPETKEVFVVKETQDMLTNEKDVLTNKKEMITSSTSNVNKNGFGNKVFKNETLVDNVSPENVEENKTYTQENEFGELAVNSHIVQKSDREIEEKFAAKQPKVEIKVDPIKLLRVADIERKNDVLDKAEESILKPNKLWKELKEKHIRISNHQNIAKLD